MCVRWWQWVWVVGSFGEKLPQQGRASCALIFLPLQTSRLRAEQAKPARTRQRGQWWWNEEGRGQQAQAPTAALCPSTFAASAGDPGHGFQAPRDLPRK